MVDVGMYYVVRPGREREFEEMFRAVSEKLAAVPGHKQARLYRDVDSPSSYLIYSEWDDKDAFTAFLQSEAFAATKAWGRTEILAAPPRHRVTEG